MTVTFLCCLSGGRDFTTTTKKPKVSIPSGVRNDKMLTIISAILESKMATMAFVLN